MDKARKIRTIALVDLYWQGHYLTYLEIFVKTLLKLRCDLIVLCPQPTILNSWIDHHCLEYKEQIRVFQISEPDLSKFGIVKIRSVINTIRRWKKTANTIRNVFQGIGSQPDLVFFASLDEFLNILLPSSFISWIFPYKWSGLYLHPVQFRIAQKYSFIRKALLDRTNLLSSRLCHSVAVLDESVIDPLQKKLGGKHVFLFPDVADNTRPDTEYSIANEIRQKSNGRKIVGLLGFLEKRKGILTLLKLAQNNVDNDLFFIFCGMIYEPDFTWEELEYIYNIMNFPPHNCFFYNNFIPDEAKFNALVVLCDVLFAVYENFYHSSNILTKAAYFKKWVLVNKGFCMDERARRFQLGLSVESADTERCYEALRDLLSGNVDLKPDYEGYLNLHSESRLRDAFERILSCD